MSWWTLVSIRREAEQLREQERSRPPVACPIDGTPLQRGPHGELFCPWDGWRPDDDEAV